jgi:hypothetical protein
LLRLLDPNIVELEQRIEVLYQRLHPRMLCADSRDRLTRRHCSSGWWREFTLPQ